MIYHPAYEQIGYVPKSWFFKLVFRLFQQQTNYILTGKPHIEYCV